jgi:hypothetical protein
MKNLAPQFCLCFQHEDNLPDPRPVAGAVETV